jgi:predicted DNA-binding transcriptional regulator AlpA
MTNESQQFLRLPAVLEMCGVGRTCWLDRVKNGDAPQPHKIGRATVWELSDIQAWIRGKMTGMAMPAAAPTPPAGHPAQRPQRLLKTYDTVEMNSFEDTIYVCALNVEDALLLGGATPGKDYKMLDLYKLAMPVAAAMFHENGNASLRAG